MFYLLKPSQSHQVSVLSIFTYSKIITKGSNNLTLYGTQYDINEEKIICGVFSCLKLYTITISINIFINF